MNIVILSGNLVKKPSLKEFGENKILNCTIAVSRRYNRDETDFINLVAFNSHAEYIDKYGEKGCRCEVQGHWQTRTWEDDEKKTHYENECIIDSIVCFSKDKKKKESEETENISVDNLKDDLPF